MAVFLTSDTHFGHDREFIYKKRGFSNIQEHDNTIIENWNKVVSPNDTVFHLGDVMLGDYVYGLDCLKKLNGNIYIIRGNHDTTNRIQLYETCDNVLGVIDAHYFHYKKYHFYLTHYPCISGSLEKDSLKKMTCNFYGHTHQLDKFFQDMPFVYNVGVDSHNCTPVNIDEAIQDMEDKMIECKKFL